MAEKSKDWGKLVKKAAEKGVKAAAKAVDNIDLSIIPNYLFTFVYMFLKSFTIFIYRLIFVDRKTTKENAI